MLYFIDFEATQYTQEIIAIGCVRSDGKTFEAKIKPRKLKNVTKHITALTGITQDDLKHERSSDAVFADFFNWLLEDKSPIKFMCFGTSDLGFVKNNLAKCTSNIRAQAALSLIASNMTDFAETVKEHFLLERAPALKKLVAYYYPDDQHTWHDALSDAEMLRMVYKALHNEKVVKGIPFPDYIGNPTFKDDKDFARFNIIRSGNDKVDATFATFPQAMDFILKQAKMCGQELNVETARKKLLSAINNGKTYFGYSWKTEVKNL